MLNTEDTITDELYEWKDIHVNGWLNIMILESFIYNATLSKNITIYTQMNIFMNKSFLKTLKSLV